MTQLVSQLNHCVAIRTAALMSMLVVMSAPVLADEYAVARYTTVRIVPTTAQRAPLAHAKAQRDLADDEQASQRRDLSVPDTTPLKPAAATANTCDE